MKIICLDTETGGTTPDLSLLTVSVGLYELLFHPDGRVTHNRITVLSLKTKPNEGQPFVIQAEALKVNGIRDLVAHADAASTYSAAQIELHRWLAIQKSRIGNRLTLLGQRIDFDVSFVQEQLGYDQREWNRLVDPRTIDLISLSRTAQVMGKLPEGKVDLDTLLEFFGYPPRGEHTSDEDIDVTVALYCDILQLIQKK